MCAHDIQFIRSYDDDTSFIFYFSYDLTPQIICLGISFFFINVNSHYAKYHLIYFSLVCYSNTVYFLVKIMFTKIDRSELDEMFERINL
jgi:hypothetical protein